MVRPRSFRNLDLSGELTMNDGAHTMLWSTPRNAAIVGPPNTAGSGYPTEVRGLNMAPDRVELTEFFPNAPQLTGVTQIPGSDTYDTSDLLANLNANHNFEVLGTNAVSADVTQYAEGGIAVATHGATNDSTIILPHLTATQSAWKTWTWGTDQQTRWEACIETPSAVTSLVIWAGLKLTNTPTLTTDANQVYIVLDTAVSASPTYWHGVYSVSNVDVDTAMTSISAVAASTKYYLVIDIDSSRIARLYVNGQLCVTSTALADATDFIPYIGIKDLSAGSARSMKIYKAKISRKSGA